MAEQQDPFPALSPWGSAASFFVIQSFGLITLQAFQVFLNIGIHGSDDLLVIKEPPGLPGRILLSIWGLGWIFIFLLVQIYMIRRARAFLRSHNGFSLFRAMRSPMEIVKLVATGVFATAYLFFLAGECPFPSRYISPWVSLAFAVVTWGISVLFARGIARVTQVKGSAGGLVVGSVFLAISLWHPETFYFAGLLGSGVVTIVICAWLLRGSVVAEDMPNPRSGRDA